MTNTTNIDATDIRPGDRVVVLPHDRFGDDEWTNRVFYVLNMTRNSSGMGWDCELSTAPDGWDDVYMHAHRLRKI